MRADHRDELPPLHSITSIATFSRHSPRRVIIGVAII
jgi:hypothetical protein